MEDVTGGLPSPKFQVNEYGPVPPVALAVKVTRSPLIIDPDWVSFRLGTNLNDRVSGPGALAFCNVVGRTSMVRDVRITSIAGLNNLLACISAHRPISALLSSSPFRV